MLTEYVWHLLRNLWVGGRQGLYEATVHGSIHLRHRPAPHGEAAFLHYTTLRLLQGDLEGPKGQ